MRQREARSSRPRLSKSRLVAGWKCPRYLWWNVHNAGAPELQLSVVDQDRIDQGNTVGRLATEEFPGGVEIEFSHERLEDMVTETRAALDAGAPAMFEASFREENVFVAVDILERLDGGFRLIEVKATNSVKNEHIPDAAAQLFVLRKAGLDVREVVLMHLNREYRRPGPGSLFLREDITAEAEAFLPEIPPLIEECREVLAGDDPGPCIGEQCAGWDCPLVDVCWPPEADHIRNLNGVGLKKALAHMAAGVHSFGDLPPEARISEKARRQLQAWRSGELEVEPTLAQDLLPFRGRLGFLDFETIMRAVPPWDGLGPYEMVPVQFSYHQRSPDGEYDHAEWLAPDDADPRRRLAEALVSATAEADAVVTYTSYENRCINALRSAASELEPELDRLSARLVDLEKVVGRDLAHPAFMGKTSIKYVLNPLVPDLTYEGMEVADGMTASVRLAKLILEGESLTAEAREAERRALLEYCKLDTLAMVRLLERLEELARS